MQNSKENNKKVSVFESLNDEDLQVLSDLKLDDNTTANVLNLFEYIDDENKSDVLEILNNIFKDKMLVDAVADDADDTNSIDESYSKKKAISERYTRILLGNK